EVLGDGQILVHVGALVEEVVANDDAALDAEREDDPAGRVRELLRERLQPRRLGIGRVRAYPYPVSFDLDVRLEAEHLRGVPPDLLDVVGLDVDEAERRSLAWCKPLLELCKRRPEREF